jgi:hypothetical protein
MNFDDFFLHPWCDRMKDVDVYNYNYVAFDEPEVALYDKPDGTEKKRLRIAVRSTDGDATILGYLPLPLRYKKHRKQLCYTIVYGPIFIYVAKDKHCTGLAFGTTNKSIFIASKWFLSQPIWWKGCGDTD